jgi:intracellular sulfur oxidation DsrE/DsrF family protein
MKTDLVRRRAVLALGSLTLPTGHAQTRTPSGRVVIQVSDADPQKWSLALNNARNVLDALGDDDALIEVVVYGPGLGMLRADSPASQRVAEVQRRGVKVVACENTMKVLGIGYSAMLPNIGYVPVGVIELMRRQQEGYAYIRP